MSRLRLNHLDFNIECSGDPSLPPLLLLHGFSGSLRTWDELVPELSRFARVIAIDLIGHGDSAAPEDVRRYSLDWAVRDLEALIDALELESTDVLGYSMGARVALYFAVHARGRVRRLMLESATPGLEDAGERAARRASDAALAGRIERDGMAMFVAEWEALPLLKLSDAVSHEVLAKLHAHRLRNSPRGLANSLRGMGTGSQPPLWSHLPRLEVPVSLIVGARDERYCEIARRMQRLLPDSRLCEIAAAGHTVHVDRPLAVLEAVRQAHS
ncbi:MAG: 2-succinyl-6-hydroxy-2,4-cyclohexadiene-1-carboxylate synthase [Chloroflexi bacterium]|nr:2-succinyl-6-hydroxy-2,4-cyclohexadiene-1-carboxylate synthase [Chloroflexota bacterium]